jgi:hypothetical protein
MTDVRADDDDRLPWLEAVDEDETRDGPSAAKLIAFVVIGLVAIGLIVGGLFWMGNRGNDAGTGGAGTDDTLIAAPEGDYKIKPEDPGGMKVDGQGGTALAASEGAEPKGQINVNAVSEAPVTAQPKAAQPTPAPTQVAQAPARPTPTPTAAATPAATPAPAGGGATIQLGAFDSAATANSAWKALSGRFKYLAPLSQSVMTAEVKGKTYYRLRASGPGARDICRRLEVAGETCIVVS